MPHLPIDVCYCKDQFTQIILSPSIASAIVQVPYIFLQTVLFVPIMYWLVGFRAVASAFFFFWLVFLMTLCATSFMNLSAKC